MHDLRLDGEPEASDDLETVEHWLRVYQELFAFTQRALQEGSCGEDSDRLRSRSLRFQSRLDYWRGRHAALVPQYQGGR